MNFLDKLSGAIARNQSLLYAGLDPSPEIWTACYGVMQRTAAGYSPRRLLEQHPWLEALSIWLHQLISETSDYVCAYRLNPTFYQMLGTAGLELLHDILQAIPNDIPLILDANHGDLNSSTLVAQSFFRDWQVAAVTLNAYAGQDLAAPFLVYPDHAIFVLCTTSNPTARVLQTYPTPDAPFYLQLVSEVKRWGTPEQVGLEVGVAAPEILERIRAIAPERVILTRSVWTEGSDLRSILEVGLNRDGSGLLIPIPPDVLAPPRQLDRQDFASAMLSAASLSPSASETVQALRDEVNQARQKAMQANPTCTIWVPNVCLLTDQPHAELILQLYDIGCLQFGEFVQASGAVFPYYIDLRTIISNPQVFDRVISAYAEILQSLEFDRIAGIPYGALPTATGLALRLNFPMIFPRKEVKAHGARRLVEGHFQPGETAVVVDDIFISGNSAMEGAAKLQSVGLTVRDIVVFIDHEKGVRDRLKQGGYIGHAVLKISEIATTLLEAGRLTEAQYDALAVHAE